MYFISTMIDEPRGDSQMVIIKANTLTEAKRRLILEASQRNWFIIPYDVSPIDVDDEAMEDLRADSELWQRLQHDNIINWTS